MFFHSLDGFTGDMQVCSFNCFFIETLYDFKLFMFEFKRIMFSMFDFIFERHSISYMNIEHVLG